ncbi:glutamyl-tRNA reductase [Anaerohalosphaera lusitana]|uniref:glutamyl-tRNA reductase n=1 Tax=Anaerohalosphaera lusitana TaxID=1936003 RepID=UPI00197BE929|nr:glutamyl-tRNA reductase [Anaerohalosphaera lusitana]
MGINHKTAPVELRERLAFDEVAALSALGALKQQNPSGEFALLCTCNRVELYAAIKKDCDLAADDLLSTLAECKGIDASAIQPAVYVLEGVKTVRHLLTVASSLDSMVIGEPQIISQVKDSYRLACRNGFTGKVLNHLFHTAFSTAKKVYSDTSITSRRVSVAGVAVELAGQLFDKVASNKVTVIGAGEMSELLVEHFKQAGCKDISVVNRSPKRGRKLARKYSIEHHGWDQLGEQIRNASILVGAAGSDEGFLFDRDSFADLLSKRRKGSLLLIDIAVPRCFDPAINDLENAYLYSIDDLAGVAQKNVKFREEEVEKAVEMICEQADDFMEWFDIRDVGPVIGKLKHRFEQIQRAEMEKFFTNCSQEHVCRQSMETTVSRVVNKLTHCVIKNIDQVAREQGAADAARLAHRMLAEAEEIAAKAGDKEDAT